MLQSCRVICEGWTSRTHTAYSQRVGEVGQDLMHRSRNVQDIAVRTVFVELPEGEAEPDPSIAGCLELSASTGEIGAA